MAERRPALTLDPRNSAKATNPKPLRSSVVSLSISLAVIMIAPLWLQIDAPLADRNSIRLAAKSPRIIPLPLPPYDNYPPPIPDEVLVRFAPETAAALLDQLADATRPFGQPPLPESLLIGARLPGEQANRALPELSTLFDRYGVWAADAIAPLEGMWRLKLAQGSDPFSIATALMAKPGVAYAEPNYPVYGFTREPNDPFYGRGNQWALRKISAPEAWDITTGSDKITIAVLDTGLAYGHSELRNKIITERSRNFVAEPANEFAWDDNGHGTYVAGIAAAETNNSSGMAGISWNAKLLSVKVLDYGYQGSIATLAMGLAYVATQPVQVVNMSTGGPVRSRILEEAAQKAYDKGIVLVAASGNSGKEEFNYPAAFDTVIAVGAADELDQATGFSTYGPYLSIIAPGSDILSLNWASDTDYARNFGTSPACPMVAGTIALMLSINPKLTPRQIRSILEGTADMPPNPTPFSATPGTSPSPTSGSPATPTRLATPIPVPLTAPPNPPIATGAIQAATLGTGYNMRSGWGRLNTGQAVQAVQNNQSFPVRQATLVGKITIPGNSLDITISLNPGDTRYPEPGGAFQFSYLPPGSYRLTVESLKYNLRETKEFTIQGAVGEVVSRNFDFNTEVNNAINSPQPIGAFRPLSSIPSDDKIRYFSTTRHSISGRFRDFWENQGGLTIFGYPISQEFQEGGTTVQYFERAILEYRPEYANTRNEVQTRLLGTLAAQNRTETAFKRLAEVGKPWPTPLLTLYFDPTGHSLSGPFRTFWEANGGLATFGYPISESFGMLGNDGVVHQVQYFQRGRMDYFPELDGTPFYIQLALLARDEAKANGLLGKG